MTGRPISPADVARALRALSPQTEAETRRIVRLLGFDLEAPAPPPLPPPPPRPDGPISKARPSLKRPVQDAEPPPPDPAPSAPAELIALRSADDDHVELPEALAVPARSRAPLLPSLFAPDRARATLTALGSARFAAGDIDVETLVRRVASNEPVFSLPLLDRLVARTSVVLVLDTSETMRYLADDQQALATSFERTFGERVSIHRVSAPPVIAETEARRAGIDGDDGDDDIDAPRRPAITIPPCARLLVVSSLGAGDAWHPPATEAVDAWAELAKTARSRGATVVALVPCPVARIPVLVRRAMLCVTWDRATSPSEVYRRIWSDLR